MAIDLYDALVVACQEVGIVPPDTLTPQDGRWHKADLVDGRTGKGDGRIRLFADGQGGQVHNWKGGSQSFFIARLNPTSQAEREAANRRRQTAQKAGAAKTEERQKKAQLRAQKLWASGRPAPKDHPYLRRKRVGPHNLRVGNWTKWRKNDAGVWERDIVIENTLLVPMVDEKGQLWNVQAIFPAKH